MLTAPNVSELPVQVPSIPKVNFCPDLLLHSFIHEMHDGHSLFSNFQQPNSWRGSKGRTSSKSSCPGLCAGYKSLGGNYTGGVEERGVSLTQFKQHEARKTHVRGHWAHSSSPQWAWAQLFYMKSRGSGAGSQHCLQWSLPVSCKKHLQVLGRDRNTALTCVPKCQLELHSWLQKLKGSRRLKVLCYLQLTSHS